MLTDEQVKAEIEAYNESLLSQYAEARESRKLVEVLKVVKFDLASDAAHQVVCYRYPIEDIPGNATIVVGHSQIALLDLDGEVIPLRPALRHDTSADNANSNAKPLNEITKKFTGGDSIMHVKVFFIQLQKHPNIPFATSGGPLQAYDAIQKIGVKIRAHGLFTAKIDDSDLTAINAQGFLKEIVGERGIVTANEFQEQLKATVEGELPGVVLPPLQNGQFPAMALSANAPAFSKQLFDIVKPKFEANLICLDELKIQKIQSEKDEEYSELLEARRAAVLAGGEAEAMRQKGYAAAEVRAAGGYSYQDERGYDVMQAAAGNNASMGTFMGAGMGLGMGMGTWPITPWVKSTLQVPFLQEHKCHLKAELLLPQLLLAHNVVPLFQLVVNSAQAVDNQCLLHKPDQNSAQAVVHLLSQVQNSVQTVVQN